MERIEIERDAAQAVLATARRDVLEEAAALCETKMGTITEVLTAKECAAKIRALTNKETGNVG